MRDLQFYQGVFIAIFPNNGFFGIGGRLTQKCIVAGKVLKNDSSVFFGMDVLFHFTDAIEGANLIKFQETLSESDLFTFRNRLKYTKMDMHWRKLNGEPIRVPIAQQVEDAILHETALGNRLKLCIGTDSQVYGNDIEFATVIVFLREGRGGFMYIASQTLRQRMGRKERLLHEVTLSIQVAYSICDLLDRYKVDLEVHADINTNPGFKSNTALSEAMGYILSMGFVFKAKPDSFASTSCANKVV